MKRALLLALMIILALSAGCAGGGDKDREKILEIRALYIGAEVFEAKVDMTADYGDRVYKYKLTYSGNGAKGELSVLEPMNIKGLIALIDGTDVVLKYDGAILDTGAFSTSGISPIEAFPLMINAWQKGFISSHYRERLGEHDCMVAEIDMTEIGGTDTILHKVWFAADTGLPVKAEITSGGFTVISCDFLEAVLR